MAVDQGLSGLNAAETQLNVIGNNISNASTVGFKSGAVQFADVYANSLGGSGSSGNTQVGNGVTASNIAQSFTQGTISTSNNPLDIAINGGGFYRLSTNGSISYSRAGQFHLSPTGAILTPTGANLTGYSASASGVLNTGVVGNLVINTANIPPAVTTTVTTGLNLNSSAPVLPAGAFSPTVPGSYSYSTSVGVYDSLGDEHSLETYYVNNGVSATAPTTGENTWNVYATLDGTLVPAVAPAATAGQIATFVFNSSGAIDATNSTPTSPTLTTPVSVTLPNGALPLNIAMTYAGTTQFSSASAVNAQSQNGYASGQLTSFSAGADGTITGTYSNNATSVLGQIVLDNFVNPNGLQSIGNNQWVQTQSSGVPLLGTPTSGTLGSLQSNAIERSNTDLTAELVNMITAQQDYQANAQTIKTADQIAQIIETIR